MRHLFFLLLTLCFIGASGQNSVKKFYEDGKSWVGYGYKKQYDDGVRWLRFTVVGDTMVAGVTAKKIQSELTATGQKSPDYRVGYENDGVVYIWLNEAFRPLYNFNLTEGDKEPYQDENGLITSYYVSIRSARYMNMEGIVRKVIMASPSAPASELVPSLMIYWIEGIGSDSLESWETITDIPEATTFDKFWDCEGVMSCYLGEKRIYDSEERVGGGYEWVDDYYAGQPEVGVDASAANDEPIYDLMGRRVENPLPGRIYITTKGKRIFR